MSPPFIRVPPPSPWAQRFRSADVDEGRAFITRSDAAHSRVVHGRGPWAFRMRAMTPPGFDAQAFAAALAEMTRSLDSASEPGRVARSEAQLISVLADALLRESAAALAIAFPISAAAAELERTE